MNVLQTHIDALEHDAAADALLDLDTEGARPDVEDCACAPVVVAVGHPLVISPVHLDVDVLAELVDAVVCRQVGHSMPTELACEAVARLTPVPLAVRHRVVLAFRAALKMNLK